jgi:2-iminobutanoate/2-iminopropanoate deaminase
MNQLNRTDFPDGTEIGSFYVRAIRTGPFVFVSGTTSLGPSGEVQGASAGEQARITLRKIASALTKAGASMGDVVRLTVYVTDIADGPEVIAEVARNVTRPITSTLVAVTALAVPGLSVEIEATAVIGAIG